MAGLSQNKQDLCHLRMTTSERGHDHSVLLMSSFVIHVILPFPYSLTAIQLPTRVPWEVFSLSGNQRVQSLREICLQIAPLLLLPLLMRKWQAWPQATLLLSSFCSVDEINIFFLLSLKTPLYCVVVMDLVWAFKQHLKMRFLFTLTPALTLVCVSVISHVSAVLGCGVYYDRDNWVQYTNV